MKEPASSWFVVGLRSLGTAAAHDVPPIASENYGTISLSTLTRTSGGGNKSVTHFFQAFQRAHHTVDRGFRHPADLLFQNECRSEHSLSIPSICGQQKKKKNSPSLRRYDPSVADARSLGPRGTVAAAGGRRPVHRWSRWGCLGLGPSSDSGSGSSSTRETRSASVAASARDSRRAGGTTPRGRDRGRAGVRSRGGGSRPTWQTSRCRTRRDGRVRRSS